MEFNSPQSRFTANILGWRQQKKTNHSMPRTSRIIWFSALLTLSTLATVTADARGGFNPNCRVPSISLCPGCTVSIKIIVLQNRECQINYGSLGAMRGQTILVGARHGKYWAANETQTAYSPNNGYLGSDYFEARFSYELMNGSKASAVLKANVEVVPHL
jgi:hypothetical protein